MMTRMIRRPLPNALLLPSAALASEMFSESPPTPDTTNTGAQYVPDPVLEHVRVEQTLEVGEMPFRAAPSMPLLTALTAMAGTYGSASMMLGRRVHPEWREPDWSIPGAGLQRAAAARARRIERDRRRAQDKERTAREQRRRRGITPDPTGGPVCCLEPMPWSEEDACYACPVCEAVHHPDPQ